MNNNKNNLSYSKSKNVKSKKKNFRIIGSAGVIISVIVVAFAYTKLNKNDVAEDGDKGGNVVIVKNEVTETAKFYPYVAYDGTKMELLAFKASDSTIRTAFNTCKVCYDSGRGYYVQEGEVLVCQNCGNRYPADKVGVEKGGCNPIPIVNDDRTEDDETITVDGSFIAQYTEYFSRWNKS